MEAAVDFGQIDIGFQLEDEDWRTNPARRSGVRTGVTLNLEHVSQFSLRAANVSEFERRPSFWAQGSQKMILAMGLPETESVQRLMRAIFVDMADKDSDWSVLGEIVRQRKLTAPQALGYAYAIIREKFLKVCIALPLLGTLL